MKNIFNKLIYFLDVNDRKTVYKLFGLFVFVGIIEVLGVVSIMPFIGMITNPEYFGNNQYGIAIKNYLVIDNHLLTILAGILFILIFISCSFLNGFTLWKTTKFSAILGKKISTNLFNHYLNQSYTFFANSDIASISKNLLQVSVSLSESIFIPILQIISRLIILILISILLIKVNIQAFIFSIALLGIIYFTIFRNIKNKLKTFGEERLTANDLLFKNTHDCFKSIKDVKFYEAEDYYKTTFSSAQKNFLNLTAKHIIFSTIPRYIIEIVAFGSIFSIIIYFQYIGVNLSQYTPTIALFILAAYRLLPSAQQIFAFSSSVRFNLPALDLIYSDMQKNTKHNIQLNINDQDDDIIFNQVSFAYESSNNILNKITFNIKKSSINAIIGSTGIGKTTLIDLLLGFYNPANGDISLSKRLYDTTSKKLKIGYVPQNVSYINESIIKNIAFGINNKDINNDRISKILKEVLLFEHVNTMNDGVYSKLGENGVRLSGGQLQRIGIGRALYYNPAVLILDEATNALDIETEKNLFNSLKINYPHLTIICITHRLSTIQLCNNILYLKKDNMSTLNISTTKEDDSYIKEIIKKVK